MWFYTAVVLKVGKRALKPHWGISEVYKGVWKFLAVVLQLESIFVQFKKKTKTLFFSTASGPVNKKEIILFIRSYFILENQTTQHRGHSQYWNYWYQTFTRGNIKKYLFKKFSHY